MGTLLKYGVQNFFCFREALNISLTLGAKCPESISQKKDFTNVLGVKGANASGKTNALKTLTFLAEICCNSFSYKPEESLLFETFFGNEKPTDFYAEFKINDIQYRYELSITKNKIISEILYRKKTRAVIVVERINNKINYTSSDFSDLEDIKIRKNASIISTAHQYESESLETIYNFFNSIISNVGFIGFLGGREDKHLYMSKFYFDNKKIFKAAKEIIIKSDTGISDIEIKRKKDEEGKNIYYPVFYHDTQFGTKRLIYQLESSGTKSLFNQLGSCIIALDIGGVLILDEFDIYLHPHLLPLILNMFLDPDTNKNDAQIIFSTHNTEIIDFLGKYRIVLINKKENESFGYRLDEIPGDIIRNDRPITPLYEAGKLGGVGNYGL